MIDIPEEYSSVDFGFSAIDEATYQSQQATSAETVPSIDENDLTRVVLNALAPLEDKLDLLMQRKQVEESDDVTLAIAQAQEEIKSKVTELEKLIMPLLVNLLKTADREYIYWPDRQAQVQATIDKVLAITRS
jgi:hypothetical protein